MPHHPSLNIETTYSASRLKSSKMRPTNVKRSSALVPSRRRSRAKTYQALQTRILIGERRVRALEEKIRALRGGDPATGTEKQAIEVDKKNDKHNLRRIPFDMEKAGSKKIRKADLRLWYKEEFVKKRRCSCGLYLVYSSICQHAFPPFKDRCGAARPPWGPDGFCHRSIRLYHVKEIVVQDVCLDCEQKSKRDQ
jgi:hypothetical protein